MMSPHAIRSLAQEQSEKAAQEGKKPYVYWNAQEVDDLKTFPFPNIGDYRPAGWELKNRYFVDKMGQGDRARSCLGIAELKETIKNRLKINHENGLGTGWAIIEEGQFQLYVGEFVIERKNTQKVKKSKGAELI